MLGINDWGINSDNQKDKLINMWLKKTCPSAKLHRQQGPCQVPTDNPMENGGQLHASSMSPRWRNWILGCHLHLTDTGGQYFFVVPPDSFPNFPGLIPIFDFDFRFCFRFRFHTLFSLSLFNSGLSISDSDFTFHFRFRTCASNSDFVVCHWLSASDAPCPRQFS